MPFMAMPDPIANMEPLTEDWIPSFKRPGLVICPSCVVYVERAQRAMHSCTVSLHHTFSENDAQDEIRERERLMYGE